MFRTTLKSLIPLVAILMALAVFAGEGRTPIYQYPTVINTPGMYIVTNNISSAGGLQPIIDIRADDVEIDLNGFVLNGGSDTIPIIHAMQQNNITIRNGTLQSGDEGIRIGGDPDEGNWKVVIEDVRILNPKLTGIILDGITDFAMRRNNVFRTPEGIKVDGTAGGGSSGPPVQGTIEDNVLEGCSKAITVIKGGSVGIINNRIGKCGSGWGISFDSSEGGLIAENTIWAVGAADPGLPPDGVGIYLGDAHGTKVYNNVVRETFNEGIHLTQAANDNMLLHNMVSEADADGIVVHGQRNHIAGNVMEWNGQPGMAGFGLHFSSTSQDNIYRGNTARGNPGPLAACTPPGTTDFCDEGLTNTSRNDNFLPTYPM